MKVLVDRGGPDLDGARPDRRRAIEIHRLDLETAPPPGGRLPDREPDARQVLPDRRAATSARGCSRSSSRITTRWLDECVDAQGRHVPADAPALRVGARRRRADLPRHRDRHRRREAAPADPAPLRPGRLHPVRRLHDDQARGPDRQEPPQLAGDGLRLGGARSARCSTSCPRSWPRSKNQGLGLRIPYTFEGDAANYLPDLLVRVRRRRRRAPQPAHRGHRRAQEGQGGQGRGRAHDCGCPP